MCACKSMVARVCMRVFSGVTLFIRCFLMLCLDCEGFSASLGLTRESASSVCVGCGSSQSVARCRRSEWSCRTSQVQSLIPRERDPRDPRRPLGSPPRAPLQIPPHTFHRMGQPPGGPSWMGQNPCGRSGNERGIRSCRTPAGK